MKASILASLFGKRKIEIERQIDELRSDLYAQFIPDPDKSNSKNVVLYELQKAMCNFMVSNDLNSEWKKKYDNTKANLDINCREAGIETEIDAGSTKVLIDNRVFKFEKKRNEDGVIVSSKDMSIELAKLGIDKEIVNKAISAATKPKKGNTYYKVYCSDE